MEDAGGLLPTDNVAAKAKDCSILQLKKYRVILLICPCLMNKYDVLWLYQCIILYKLKGNLSLKLDT